MHIIQKMHSFLVMIDLNEKFIFLPRIFNYYNTFIAKCYTPWLATREPLAGFPKGRSIPLVEGGVNAPPENASVQGD